jgi:hypothetical protein
VVLWNQVNVTAREQARWRKYRAMLTAEVDRAQEMPFSFATPVRIAAGQTAPSDPEWVRNERPTPEPARKRARKASGRGETDAVTAPGQSHCADPQPVGEEICAASRPAVDTGEGLCRQHNPQQGSLTEAADKVVQPAYPDAADDEPGCELSDTVGCVIVNYEGMWFLSIPLL